MLVNINHIPLLCLTNRNINVLVLNAMKSNYYIQCLEIHTAYSLHGRKGAVYWNKYEYDYNVEFLAARGKSIFFFFLEFVFLIIIDRWLAFAQVK